MAITSIDGILLKDMFKGADTVLRNDKQRIDELNVFPVPDGDTGTNMLLTFDGGLKAVINEEISDVSEFMSKNARGALLGARGNSGVILSQFIRGFSNGCEGKAKLGIADFTEAFRSGVDRAYSAVIKPTEGTILTVMREGCEYMEEKSSNITNFQDYFARLNKKMEESLENTPELLPVLKESGVVDSGGAGFICLFHGMERVLNGETPEEGELPADLGKTSSINPSAFNADSELVYGYCTEFILQLQNSKVDIAKFDLQKIISYLESVGNSIVCIRDEDLVKVHVHTFRPGDVLNFGQNFGEYITLKIENMSVQHNETSMFREDTEPQPKKAEHKDIAVVAVVNGPGLKKYFTELGVDICVDGGQTDNPSTADFIKAFDELDADHIIVLPCNSNIVMASTQAAEMYEQAAVHVVGAKTLSEGYSALSMMDLSDGDCARVIEEMEDCIAHVRSGMITTSIRDVDYENVSVKKGHYIGMDRHNIISDAENRLDAVKGLIKGMDGIEDYEVLTIFYGAEVPEEELETLGEMIEREFPWLEYGCIEGGQEVYDYIFAIE